MHPDTILMVFEARKQCTAPLANGTNGPGSLVQVGRSSLIRTILSLSLLLLQAYFLKLYLVSRFFTLAKKSYKTFQSYSAFLPDLPQALVHTTHYQLEWIEWKGEDE